MAIALQLDERIALAVDGELRHSAPLPGGGGAASLRALVADLDVSGGVLLVVAEQQERSALGRLLSSARAAQLPVAAFVGATALEAAAYADGNAAVHVELGAAQARLSLVLATPEGWRLRRSLRVPLAATELDDALLQLAARVIVRNTRFDTLHDAAHEAALREQLAAMRVPLLVQGAAEGRLRAGERELSFALTRDQVRTAIATPLRGLLDGVPALQPPAGFTLLGPRALLQFPGVAELLGDSGATGYVALDTGAAAVAASRLAVPEAPGGAAVPLLTRFAREQLGARWVAPAVEPIAGFTHTAPTHLVAAGRAHAIDATGLVVGRLPATPGRGVELPAGHAGISRRHCTVRREGADVVVIDHSHFGSYVDGRRVQGRARLLAGQRLRLGTPGVELALVAVD